MKISKAIRVMRAIRGLTQVELGKRAGILRDDIWRIEQGFQPPKDIEAKLKEALRWPEGAEEALDVLEGEGAEVAEV